MDDEPPEEPDDPDDPEDPEEPDDDAPDFSAFLVDDVPDVSEDFSDDFSEVADSDFSDDLSPDEDSDEPEPERLSLRYQPLPLKTMPTDEKTFRRRPPHSGHSVNDGSLNAWTCSKRWSQAVQA